MRKNKWYLLLFLLLNVLTASSQKKLNYARFFEEDKLITMDLSTDLKKLVSEKKLESYQPATVTLHFPDSTEISEPIQLTARGEFRRTECFVPAIKLDFNNPASSKLALLKKLKLVNGCGTNTEDERLLLKEFLIYKMYNLFSEMSFRVRLLHINYSDTREKIKSYTQYGFVIEDVDKMAKRNKCYEVEKQVFRTEGTDRQQMTLAAIFQYMIGNTDWSIPNYHNIKLMRPVSDSVSFPYVIPYDFDICGLVDPHYATVSEELPISSVRERLYRGFPRTIGEVQTTLNIFREKREVINKLIMNFEPLDLRSRKEMIDYLDEFYKTIENNNQVQRIFIKDARVN